MSSEDQPKDHVEEEAAVEDVSDFEKNVKSSSTWLRMFFIALFFVFYAISRPILFVVVVIQFVWVLFTSELNRGLLEFGQSLATWTYHVVRYLTFNSDDKPFPFDQPWPSANSGEASGKDEQ